MQGKIVKNLGKGRYRVEIRAALAVDAALKDLRKKTQELESTREKLNLRIRNEEKRYAAEQNTLNLAIEADEKDAQREAMNAMTLILAELDSLLRAREGLRLRLAALESEIGRLEAIQAQSGERDLWCADFSEELSGDVGLCAVAGNPDHVRISPSGKKTDKHLLSTAAMPLHMAAWHQITEPAMEKWWPSYRTGTLTALNMETGLATVVLDEARSRLRPDIRQNPEAVLEAVPFTYMSCDHRAFREGDRVLVQWVERRPVVVGFSENPRPCMERLWITFKDIAGSQAFATLCDRRIAELQQDRAHATYCRDVFIPQVLALYRAWRGKYFNYQHGIPWGKVGDEDVDRLSAPWIAWRDSLGGEHGGLGCQSYVDAVDRAILSWQNMKTIARNAAAYLTLTSAGGRNTAEDCVKTPLSHAVWVLDGCAVDINPALLDTGNPSMARQSALASAAMTTWDAMALACAPVLTCELRAGTSIAWQWQARAGFLPDGESVLFSRGFRLSLPGFDQQIPLEGCTLTVTADGADLFRYPAPWPVHAAMLDTSVDTGIGIPLELCARGRLGMVFSDFGAEVRPQDASLPYVTGGIFYGDDPFTWMGYQAAGISHGMTGAGDGTRLRVPAGFEVFAGRHPEHPIVTGINDGRRRADNLSPDQRAGQLRQVNDAINRGYAYRGEAEGRDSWRFMTTADPWGDCEDFALTKIERLLDFGWDIADLQIQVGRRPVWRWSAEENKKILTWVGHAWVLAGEDTVLDNGGDLTTVEAMRGKGYQDLLTQRGLTWTDADRGTVYTALPYPHYGFDVAVMAMTATATRWGGREKSPEP